MVLLCCARAAQPPETNAIFGMHSGLALLMDVYRPAKSNGYGIIVIPGCGWRGALGYDARPLKDSREFVPHVERLTAAGYTAFTITHRVAPRFQYPAAVEDAQRAVRFVRHFAARYGIRADRIGALGGSSGGHLVSMLGTAEGSGDPQDPDAVQRESAKVQCVVAFYAFSDLTAVDSTGGLVHITEFMGMRPPYSGPKGTLEQRRYREASPLSHVSPDDPPFLLIHGDGDKTVPFHQSELMEAALKKAGVPVKLIRVPGGGHTPSFTGTTEKADWEGATVQWFDGHLRKGE
jgi:acetyl esterase/lipase